ncbi:MAG: DUF3143 domain-containing protein [Thermostichales cyanobacterium SZTDM-1c_bins_54]
MLPDSAPIYNHPLPVIESWLEEQGCERDEHDPTCWTYRRGSWQVNIHWEETAFRVDYRSGSGVVKTLLLPYALSRADVQRAIFDLEQG